MRRLRPRTPLAVTGLVAVAFLAGLSVDHAAAAARAAPYRALDVFAAVLAHVENSYVGEVEEEDLVYGAIEGLVSRLDPHTAFFRPEQYRQLCEETAGEFDGLGIEVTIQGGVLTVVSPMADSPGERGGIRAGDRILSIDGVPTRDLTLAESTRRMKGAIGTRAVLEVMRDGFAAPQKLTLLRARVHTRSVEWQVLDPARGQVHVRVTAFQDRTEHAVKQALDDARAQLGGEVRGVVLDLRNNPGGLLDQAVRVADLFLASGVIVSTEGRGGRNVEIERAREKGTEPAYPMVALVNKGSASASEIVAGALQDHGRAVIMGTRTFGKGSVQTIIELPDGSGLKLTAARYYTPKHRSIHELGITPDVVVADAAPAAAAQGPSAAGDDYPLRAALEYLRALEVPGGPAPAAAREAAAAGRGDRAARPGRGAPAGSP